MRDWIICIKQRGGRVKVGQGMPAGDYPPGRWYTLSSRVLCCGGCGFLDFSTNSLIEKEKIIVGNGLKKRRFCTFLEKINDG